MTGRLVRGFCTAAVAAGTLVATGPAVALPARPPTPPGPTAGSQESRDASGRARTDRRPGTAGQPWRAGGQAPAAGPGSPWPAGPTPIPGAVHGAPGAPGAPTTRQRSVPTLQTDLQRLYHQAERAADAYRAADQRLRRQRLAVASLDRRLTGARRALHRSRSTAGRLARLQYQGSADASPYLRLLLARDPQHALDQSHMLQRMSKARVSAFSRIAGDEAHTRALATTARHALAAQRTLAQRQRQRRDTVQSHLGAVQRLLASLGGGRLSEPRRGTRSRLPGSMQSLLDRALHGARPPSVIGSAAIRYALRQIGRPYRWGAAGPDAFDCSGLTSQAWAHAGRTIPRTSQGQWARLAHVPMASLRPGDLVVYYPTATHVALYLGGGMVVQAPRSGENVKVSPVRGNPVLGAVRPDPGAAALVD